MHRVFHPPPSQNFVPWLPRKIYSEHSGRKTTFLTLSFNLGPAKMSAGSEIGPDGRRRERVHELCISNLHCSKTTIENWCHFGNFRCSKCWMAHCFHKMFRGWSTSCCNFKSSQPFKHYSTQWPFKNARSYISGHVGYRGLALSPSTSGHKRTM